MTRMTEYKKVREQRESIRERTRWRDTKKESERGERVSESIKDIHIYIYL